MAVRRSSRLHFRCPLSILLVVCLAGLLLAAAGSAEIYRWQDGQGRLHFAQDLSQVPPKYRRQAEIGALAGGNGSPIQRYESAPAAVSRSRHSSATGSAGSASGPGKVHRIKVAKSGLSMRVMVRLNDSFDAPFIIDTGASDVALPEWVAKKLGLDLDGARTHFYRTANGTVQQQVVILESVSLGGARVEKVPASVSKTMGIGLLGLSYFNHFRYRVDPVAGIVTLEDNGMLESGRIRGGRSESQWKNEFRILARRRDAIEQVLEQSSSNRSRRKAELKGAIEEVDRQIEVLEDEADEARVPMRWRF
jgi:clan AA aspartic protease (TIGR02281 family)